MNKTLIIECGSIACTSTVNRGEDKAHIKMTLEEVRIFELMQELIKKIGPAAILDCIKDEEIKTYLKGSK